MDLSGLGEFGLIGLIRERFASIPSHGCEGIGDDCAVLPLNTTESMVVTTDLLVEDIHFLRDRITPEQLGRKSLAVNLSDVAAMGAAPVAAGCDRSVDRRVFSRLSRPLDPVRRAAVGGRYHIGQGPAHRQRNGYRPRRKHTSQTARRRQTGRQDIRNRIPGRFRPRTAGYALRPGYALHCFT